MTEPNFESKWFGYIYDQIMENMSDLVENHYRFYLSNLHNVTGPVLECACGTGLFLLPLLASGHNMFGFDISNSMLAALKTKALEKSFDDIGDMISVQDLEFFHYNQLFDAIIIPTNSFSMLATQDAQIRALRNVFNHLVPGGKLLLDIRHVGMRSLVEDPEIVEGKWYVWTHPETNLPIRQRINGRYDFNNQLILDHCFIEYEGQTEDFPITGRWIFKDEFQLLLRLGGFSNWEYFSTPDRDPLQIGLEDTIGYWIAYKT